jgi:hypothetical protein
MNDDDSGSITVESTPSYLKRATTGALAALAIGFVIIGTCNAGWAISRGVPIKPPWDSASLPLFLFASAPYLILAFSGVNDRRPWTVGLCLTAAFWGFYLFQITRPYEGGGADIGLGLLMIFSPVPIIVGCLIATATLKKRG